MNKIPVIMSGMLSKSCSDQSAMANVWSSSALMDMSSVIHAVAAHTMLAL